MVTDLSSDICVSNLVMGATNSCIVVWRCLKCLRNCKIRRRTPRMNWPLVSQLCWKQGCGVRQASRWKVLLGYYCNMMKYVLILHDLIYLISYVSFYSCLLYLIFYDYTIMFDLIWAYMILLYDVICGCLILPQLMGCCWLQMFAILSW